MKVQTISAVLFSSALAGLVLAGCAQQQHARHQPAAAVTTGEQPRVPLGTAMSGYGPSYARFEEAGTKWVRGSMAFPTGQRETSGLLIEKTVPAEILAGQKFDYAYKISNLIDSPIEAVTLSDRVGGNFTPIDSDPPASETKEGVATWLLGTLGPKESKTVHVRGSAPDEGSVTTCGWASYRPVLCEDIKVLKPNIQLTKTAPPEVMICDPIPMTVVVKNTGSSALDGVKVTHALPEGLTAEGQSSVSFDAGTLPPGESKEFKYTAVASKTGEFVNKAQATAAQGVTAEASSKTVVREPMLTLACAAPEQRYMGRPFDINFTVANKGDAAAAGTVIEVPLPEGLSLKAASDNGQTVGNKVMWDLGSLPINETRSVTATVVSTTGGNFQLNASAKGLCSKLVSSGCETKVVGVAAILLEKADDPDPVSVGESTVYTVKVTNQGFADDNNVKIAVTIAPELVPVSATGNGTISGQTVTFPTVSRLAGKEAVSYQITVKGVKAGDGRTRFQVDSDMLHGPVTAEESTHVY